MDKLATTLNFINIMTDEHGWALSKALDLGPSLIVDKGLSLSEAVSTALAA